MAEVLSDRECEAACDVGLTTAERQELASLESVLAKHAEGFVAVGLALARIRDSRLYRGAYGTFEPYCQDRWGFGRCYAHRLTEAAIVVDRLPPGIKPRSERVARPLTRLPPEQQAGAWAKALATVTDGDVTARHVETVVSGMLGSSDCGPHAAIQFVSFERLRESYFECLPSDQHRFIEWIESKGRVSVDSLATDATERRATIEETILEADYATAVSAIANNLGESVRGRIASESPDKVAVIAIARLRPSTQRKALEQLLGAD